MKSVLMVILGMICNSCGPLYKTQTPITVEKEVIKEKNVEVNQQFEGVFFLENNSTLELLSDFENKVTIDTRIQVMTSENPQNGTFGEHPRITGTDLLVKDGKVRWTLNVNYTTGNDIEEDASGANIVGQKRTDYLIEFINDKLRVTVSIWNDKINNNANNIIAKRILEEI